MAKLSNMRLPNVNEDKVDLWDIDLTITTPSPDNIQLLFDPTNDGLRLVIRDLSVRGKFGWKVVPVKVSVVRIPVSGNAKIEGVFDEISIVLGFKTQGKGGYQVPAVYTKSTTVNFDKKKWRASVGNNVIEKIANKVINAFKGKGLRKMKTSINDALNQKVPNTINSQIMKSFEIEAPITPWLTMNVALVSPIRVNANSLIMPINGTIYPTGFALNTTYKPSEVMLSQANSENDVSLTVSDHVFNTFTDSMNQFDFEYKIASNGYNVRITIPGNKKSISIKPTDKGLHVVAKGTCTVIQSGTSFDVKISGDVSFNFTNGDDNNMFYFNPILDEKSIDISTSNIFLVRQKLGLGLLSPIFGPMVEYFAKNLKLDPVPIKKIPDFPLVLNYSNTEFNPNFMAVRLDV